MKTITYDDTKWKLVPVEPAIAMVTAAEAAYYRSKRLMGIADAIPAAIVAAIEAAPTPPAGDAGQRMVDASRLFGLHPVPGIHTHIDEPTCTCPACWVLASKGEKPRYWLCCGSTDPRHPSNCLEAKTGHPERCRYGTADEHSAWSKGEKG